MTQDILQSDRYGFLSRIISGSSSTTLRRPHRKRNGQASFVGQTPTEQSPIDVDQSLKPSNGGDSVNVKRATRTRKITSLVASFFFFISFIFLILVLIGNTHIKPVLTDVWFIRLDLSNVVPRTVPNAVLINSIARTLGLHDFYQVGVWNFCEGYKNEGVTWCSRPKKLYWFNPVEILLNELLAGATSV